MQLNIKVIKKWQRPPPPPISTSTPPFHGYPLFLAKFLVERGYNPGDSIFWRSYPPPPIPPIFNKGGRGRGGGGPTMTSRFLSQIINFKLGQFSFKRKISLKTKKLLYERDSFWNSWIPNNSLTTSGDLRRRHPVLTRAHIFLWYFYSLITHL